MDFSLSFPHYSLRSKLTGCTFCGSLRRKSEKLQGHSALPWRNSHHCPVVSSVPAGFVHLLTFLLLRDPAVSRNSAGLCHLCLLFTPLGTAAFTPEVWQQLRHPQTSSLAGAWEGITLRGVKPFCCCSFR